jgi:DDE family transposase
MWEGSGPTPTQSPLLFWLMTTAFTRPGHQAITTMSHDDLLYGSISFDDPLARACDMGVFAQPLEKVKVLSTGRQKFELTASGIHRDELDEDISLAGLLADGHRALLEEANDNVVLTADRTFTFSRGWAKIAFISQNWRAKPSVSHEVIVNLISVTTTQTGLEVQAKLDTNAYPPGAKVSKKRSKR